jgi:hypothetical protein
MKLIPIGNDVKITYLRDGETNTTHAKAMRNPGKGIISQPSRPGNISTYSA